MSLFITKYRGAAPIQWALMNGDTETGVTIFQINRKVDTGDILVQKNSPFINMTIYTWDKVM